MSRNFTADLVFADRLVLNDTDAFEGLYYRYWYSLYFYGLRKLHSPEDAKHLVRTIFNVLWQNRHTLPASIRLSEYLYAEGKKEIINCLNQKIISISNLELVETETILNENTQFKEATKIADKKLFELTIQQNRKLIRYVNGQAMTAEQWQIQDWPSGTKPNTYLSRKEKRHLEQEILREIQAYTRYSLFFPKKANPWWQKIAAMF